MAPASEISIEEIRTRAYDIWERNHCPSGFEVEFWLLAERELRAEREAKRRDASDAGPADERAASNQAPNSSC
ncbi:DUF2934 domain-containing protein [Methylobacterium nodulans]|uniref:DUF2934 domain-containing protein n=1 Tax=Methylobacterium nodulans (strain LMG 21967 / CNCM I-2342 / ORS 2060) TaxID=460265 RepID=B8IWT4_METNO|nr:DUF2934 domain-containing protein [Methylobacterium nodulans]ACL62975.1 hypothetical protein Mnod_7973 [Methylobacterium nodulans ORS 2060]